MSVRLGHNSDNDYIVVCLRHRGWRLDRALVIVEVESAGLVT